MKMNRLKLLVALFVAFISFTNMKAQTDSTEKATINKSKKEISEIVHDGINYYVINGIWYIKFKNKLVLRRAPKGAKITFLPKDGKMVTMGGKKYYKSNGVFYKKLKGNMYEVTSP